MNKEDYDLVVQQTRLAGHHLSLHHLSAAREEAARAYEIGWFVDPRVWKAGNERLKAVIRCLDAASALVRACRELDAVIAKTQADAGGEAR